MIQSAQLFGHYQAMGVRSINLREFYDASGDLIPLPCPIQPTL